MTHYSATQLVNQLHTEYALSPVVAAEIECYVMLADESSESMDAFWVPVEQAFTQEGLSILRIEKERGAHQYEIITHVMKPEMLIETLWIIRAVIEKYAQKQRVKASFAGKPFADQPSSGLHVHLHLANDQGLNSYHKTDEWTSDTLRWSLGGLLEAMPRDMPIFFPSAADHQRLDDVDHVPKIFGWGVNNRYCALRIPANPDPYDKRIEHRVACPNADPRLVVGAILGGVLKGLRERIEPTEQHHGKTGGKSMKELAAAAVA